jgi:DNA polymerase-3 subunit delta
LGSDRGVTRSELEKLALYATGDKVVTMAHVEAVMGDESELRMTKPSTPPAKAIMSRWIRHCRAFGLPGHHPWACSGRP